MLKHLPRSELNFLLYIFNLSRSSRSFPSIWKTSSIIPIHKMGKPLDSPASFRPISLTSCVSKLFERIILSRLLFFLESNSILSPRQAGFRPGRSTLDHILYLSQSISDGFNKPRPGSRTILSTIDFSKAFDSVWHPALFHKLISAASFLALLAGLNLSFLIGALLWSTKITKVVSFESVEVFCKDPFLALYFFLYSLMIFRPLCLLPSAALFRLTVWPFGPPPPRSPLRWRPHKELCFDWSTGLSTGVFLSIQANVRPPPSKCEDPHQANLQPNLLLLGSRLRFNPTPTFLGVIFDRTLSFSKQVSSLKTKFFPRLKALRCISASSWGPSKESLSLLYESFLRSLLTYASPGWFPFLSATNLTKLERLHRAASRAITGCFSSSLIPLLLSEASLPPLRVTLTHFTLFSYERALRLPTSIPISGLVRLGVKPRLCRSFWRVFASTHRSCFLLLVLGRLFLLALPFLLGICLRSRSSPPFPLHALALIPPSLAKVRFSPTLTLSLLMIWCFEQTALFLLLLVRAAAAFLPTALSVALRRLFPFRQAQYAQVFPLKPAPFCTLYAGLGSTNKSAISLLFSYYLTLVLSSPPCPLLHLSSYLKLCDKSGRNCLLSPPVLSGYNGSLDTHFYRGTTRLMS